MPYSGPGAAWRHPRRARDVLFERCRAVACGVRSGTLPAELYQGGFYVRAATLRDCHAERCRKVGFLCKNQIGGLTLVDCSDTGSGYGLVVEYGGTQTRVTGFVSEGETRRVLQMVGNNAEVEIEIRNFAGDGRPVLLGPPSGSSSSTRPGTRTTWNGTGRGDTLCGAIGSGSCRTGRWMPSRCTLHQLTPLIWRV